MPSAPGQDPRPDPTSDLHWGDYKGAIYEIFAANAAKHPERTCIVETASSTSPKRVRPCIPVVLSLNCDTD